MLRTALGRLGAALFTLGFVSLVVFAAVEALPGNVCTAYLQRFAQGPRLERCLKEQGLERPAPVRYAAWAAGLARGDLGTSLKRREPLADLVAPRLRNTALMAGLAAGIGVPLALALGLVAGLRRDGPVDLAVSGLALLAMTIPEFVTSAVLIFVFAITLGWVPAVTVVPPTAPLVDFLPSLVLPVAVLALVMTAHILRMTRAAVVELMASDFVQMARLKRVPERRIVWRHLAPSALVPSINVVALTVAWLLGGVVVVERVFNYPGMGGLMLSAIHDRDMPLVQAIALIFAAIYIAADLAADLAVAALDPRVRAGGAA